MKTKSTLERFYNSRPAILLLFLIILFTVQPSYAQGDNWRVTTIVPIPRADAASCVVDGNIYVIGGESREYVEGQTTIFNTVSRYNIETGAWDQMDSIPEPRWGAYACYINNRIYVFGGCKDPSSYNTRTIYIYDIQKNEWTSGSDMPRATSYAEGCVHDNKVYLIGGCKDGTINWDASDMVFRYDPAADSWDSLAPMNQSRWYLSVSVVNDKIYAIGGASLATGLNVVEEYDPVSDQWETKTPIPTTRLAGHISVVFNDRIWVMSGGISGPPNGMNNDTVYIYEPATDSWSYASTEDVPSVIYTHPSMVTFDKKVYLFCGFDAVNFKQYFPEMTEFDFPVARVQTDTIVSGESFEVLFYEDGDIYVTPSGTEADKASIEAAKILEETGTAGQKITLQMDSPGSYWIYGIASDERLDRGYSSVVTISTSVSQEKIPDFRFYPNPAEDDLTVELPFTGDICLLDQLGRIIIGISDITGETTLSVSELPQGIYFLRVCRGLDSRVKKVIVE